MSLRRENGLLEINIGETSSFSGTIFTDNPAGEAIPLDLTGKTLYLYIKKKEQRKDNESEIIKSSISGEGILITNAQNGEFEIEISSDDTIQFLEENITQYMRYSLRLVYGNVNRFISEGPFIITPR